MALSPKKVYKNLLKCEQTKIMLMIAVITLSALLFAAIIVLIYFIRRTRSISRLYQQIAPEATIKAKLEVKPPDVKLPTATKEVKVIKDAKNKSEKVVEKSKKPEVKPKSPAVAGTTPTFASMHQDTSYENGLTGTNVNGTHEYEVINKLDDDTLVDASARPTGTERTKVVGVNRKIKPTGPRYESFPEETDLRDDILEGLTTDSVHKRETQTTKSPVEDSKKKNKKDVPRFLPEVTAKSPDKNEKKDVNKVREKSPVMNPEKKEEKKKTIPSVSPQPSAKRGAEHEKKKETTQRKAQDPKSPAH